MSTELVLSIVFILSFVCWIYTCPLPIQWIFNIEMSKSFFINNLYWISNFCLIESIFSKRNRINRGRLYPWTFGIFAVQTTIAYNSAHCFRQLFSFLGCISLVWTGKADWLNSRLPYLYWKILYNLNIPKVT